MTKNRRSSQEIQKDCIRIQEASKIAKTIKELQKLTGLSYMQIKTSFIYQPELENAVKSALKRNWDNAKNVERAEERTKKNITKKLVKPSRSEFEALKPGIEYVLDASIAELSHTELDELFFRIIYLQSKIMITSITNDELEKLKDSTSDNALKANSILRWAAISPQYFEAVKIRKKGVADDCIIEYCIVKKEKRVLLTFDKHMAIDARSKGVEVIFFSDFSLNHEMARLENKYLQPKESLSDTIVKSNSKYLTLDFVSFRGGVLSISKEEFRKKAQLILVKRKDTIYERGSLQLTIGMEIFHFQRNSNHIQFLHGIITGIAPTDYCKILSSRTISSEDEGGIDQEMIAKAREKFYGK